VPSWRNPSIGAQRTRRPPKIESVGQRDKRWKSAVAKRERGGFVPLPFTVIRSQSFAGLSAHAVKLLCDLLAQYRGDNNGDLCLAWKIMNNRRWRSRDTLQKARTELLDKEWIVISRRGGRHQATLYAVTFYAIDYCAGKLDIASTGSPTGEWRKNEPLPALPKLKVVARPPCQSATN
jgi:hypothetical protein